MRDRVLVVIFVDRTLGGFLEFGGGGKIGNPCARFTAPLLSARRVISRITDSLKCLVFVETSVGIERPSILRSDVNARRSHSYPDEESFWQYCSAHACPP